MTNIFDGKNFAQKICQDLTPRISELKKLGITPKLVIIAIQPDKRSQIYIRTKQKQAGELGIATELIKIASDNIDQIETAVTQAGNNPSVHGIIIQLPLPKSLNTEVICDFIPPHKDVDGLTSANVAALQQNHNPYFLPATPLAILEVMKAFNLTDGPIAIVGQGKLVGQPITHLLQRKNTQVMTADDHTPDLTTITATADTIISATGQAHLIKADMIKPKAAIINAGISILDNKVAGDIDFENVKTKAGFITPALGGIGPVTVAILMQNVVLAAENSTN